MSPSIAVRHHATRASAISRSPDGCFSVALESGGCLDVTFVFVTTGHSGSGPHAAEQALEDHVEILRKNNRKLFYLRDLNPIERLDEIGVDARVAICGMGLTAFDAVSMFTHGRGGRFSLEGAHRLRYHASGREPRLVLFSRQGLPPASKAIDQKTPGRLYRPKVFTTALVERLKRAEGKLDWDRDLLPHLVTEMALRMAGADQDTDVAAPEHMRTVDAFLHPWKEARIHDPQTHAAFVRRHLEADIAASFVGNVDHPLKAVTEMVRDLNDVVRAAVDYAGLTGESHRRFLRNWCSIANRIAAGPPKERSMELLALIESGVLSVFEPNPTITLDEASASFRIAADVFGYRHEESFDVLVQARVGLFQADTASDPLLRSGLDQGLFSAFDNDGFAPSGIAIDGNLNVVGLDGRPVPNCWAMGYVVEGAHYYTYVLPCPFANSRSLRDAGKAVSAMIAEANAIADTFGPDIAGRELASMAN